MSSLRPIACAIALCVPAAQAATLNPDVSVILDGRFTSYDNDPEAYELPGFMLGGEAGLDAEGFVLGHTELVLSANVDDRFYGKLTAALHSHEGATEVDLEEAYVETLGLGSGLTVKAGRFYSGLGYLNEHHPHAWDFADAPLVYRALFGDQLRDDGVQVRWVAPTDLFLQVGLEVGRGETFPAAGAVDGAGSRAAFVELGGDLGTSHFWQVGLSRWWTDVAGRTGGGHDHGGGATETPTFDGDSAVVGIDFVWKWAPDGNPSQRNFKLQAEYFQREEDGTVTLAGSDPLEVTGYDGTQRGGYLQGTYQFMPRWRVGLRYDRIEADNDGDDTGVLAEAGLDDEGHTPSRTSVMVDWSRSEFSRVRLQYNRDDSYPDADSQWLLQYVMSLGAHGAHKF